MRLSYQTPHNNSGQAEMDIMGKKFNKLEKKIEREYEKKGYSVKESKHIGQATAGKIYRHLKG